MPAWSSLGTTNSHAITVVIPMAIPSLVSQ